jgi:hypothetical protein
MADEPMTHTQSRDGPVLTCGGRQQQMTPQELADTLWIEGG